MPRSRPDARQAHPATPGEALAAYLERIGGCDRIEAWDADGQPDPLAARRLAEDLRERAGALLGEVIAIEQSANRVVVRKVDDACLVSRR